MRQDVEFEGFDGVGLRGWLHSPADSNSALPAVVLTNGFSATTAMRIEAYAARLCQAGIAVLVYDHRNLGRSNGQPRHQINPWAQMRDLRRAIGWLARRPTIDADRIGIAGISFSGGQALIVAACDPRVRAIAAVVPFAGFADTDYSDCRADFEKLRAAVLDEGNDSLSVATRSDTGEIAVVAAPGDERRAYLPQSEAAEWFLARGNEPNADWSNTTSVINAYGTEPRFDPGVCIESISPTPLLMVVATQDRLAASDVALAAYARAGEPRRHVAIDGHHFSAYEGPGVERAAEAVSEFFSEML